MKNFLLVFICLAVSASAFSQKDPDEITTKSARPLARLDQADRLMVDVFTDIWMNKPGDSMMSIKTINMGSNTYFFRDIPIGRSNFSFAVGAGISCHNQYSDAAPVRETVADSTSPWNYVFTGKTTFAKIPSDINGNEIKIKNNKLTVAYIDIPVEFRFRTRNEGQKFKAALGFKIGYLISSHTKYHGSDIVYDYETQAWALNSDKNNKVKFFKIPNIESYRMGPTFRIGWGWVNLSAYYSLTNLFKKDHGPAMNPLSVGISITPL
jgi:hypothetical protein